MNAACQVFAEKGYRQATMEDVARKNRREQRRTLPLLLKQRRTVRGHMPDGTSRVQTDTLLNIRLEQRPAHKRERVLRQDDETLWVRTRIVLRHILGGLTEPGGKTGTVEDA